MITAPPSQGASFDRPGASLPENGSLVLRNKMMRDQKSEQDCEGLPAQSLLGQKGMRKLKIHP
jgi:hypothetical protein